MDPITIAIALTLLSAGANYMSGQQQMQASADYQTAERLRQKKLDEEAAAINNQSRERLDNYDEKQGDRQGELAALFAPAPDAPGGTGYLPAQESTVLAANDQREGAKAREFGAQQGDALADVRAFTDMFANIGLEQGRDAGRVGAINSYKRGSSGLLAGEMQAAQGEGAGWALAGDVLGAAGQVAMGSALGPAAAGAKGSLFPVAASGPANTGLTKSAFSGIKGLGGLY